MRWFTAWLITVAIACVVALLLWLRTHPPLGVTAVSDGIRWLIPGPLAAGVRTFQVWLMFGVFAIVRAVLHRVLAYTSSAVDASPRALPGKRAAIGAAMFHLFHNPARWWLAPFLTLVVVWLAVSGPFVFFFDRSTPAKFVWGLMSLYGATLAGAIANPDRPQSLHDAAETALDPVLAIPGERAGPHTA